MNPADVEYFRRLVHTRSGLMLGPEKTYLIQTRLEPIARAQGLAGVSELLTRLAAGAPDSLVRRAVDAMATHESLFFRDATPFQQLAEVVLPQLVASRPAGRPIRIWCAACSSGQEPYSIAILAKELNQVLGGRPVEIVATDMAEAVVERARRGVYNDFEVRRGLSPERLQRWFLPHAEGWQVSATLKAMVSFRSQNLLAPMTGLSGFDIVFCRNVLIYFDPATKGRVLDALAGAMAPDGALFLGSAETIIGLTDRFALSPGSRGVYRPTQALAKAG